MRKDIGWALASVVSLGFSGLSGALAADMAVKARPVVAAPVVTYNWSGCYIGGNLGGGWAKVSQVRIGINPNVPLPAQNFGASEGSAFIGGGQVGCDYQFAGNWVVGAQGMFDFGNMDSSHIIPPFPTFFARDRTKDIFTATARIGYLFVPQLLGYVKGGGAWTRTDSTVFGTSPFFFLSESALGNDRSGWTVGGGLEWMFWPGWSVFAEYNFMDFGTKTFSYIPGPGTVGTGDIIQNRLRTQTALVGLNFKFDLGFGKGPVVARY